MGWALGSLVRRLGFFVLYACGLAIYVARLEPPSSEFRLWSEPRYRAFNATLFLPIRERTEILDTESGRLQPLDLPRGEVLQWAGFSNWIGDRDQVVAAGRWTASSGSGGELAYQVIGLGRFFLPSGRPINRVRTEHVPASELCWFPRSTSRVLFAAANGRLYRYEFPKIAESSPALVEGDPQEIAWPNRPAGVSDVWIQEPTWPTDGRLEGRLFAVVRFQHHGEKKPQRHQIWWLRLDAAAKTVVEAGRLASDEPGGGVVVNAKVDERLPRLVTAEGGELILAYYVTLNAAARSELRVARVRFDPQTHAPTIRHAESRTLIDDYVATPPVFTPSGDALLVLTGRPGAPTVLRRIDRSKWFTAERRATAIRGVATGQTHVVADVVSSLSDTDFSLDFGFGCGLD